jgi:pimeloyl-ACP methyl ester carboxylesterase
MASSPNASAPLSQRFDHKSSTHSYTVHWTAHGSSACPPLIFIHGTPWSSRVWVPFALSLSRYFHVYLFDNPGFGASPLGRPLPGKEHDIPAKVALDADLAEQSAVFAALVRSWADSTSEGWNGRAAHVVAHDHGGLMALRAHLLHGCPYASLCLIDVVALGPFGQPLFRLVAENEGLFRQLGGSVFEGVVEAYIRDAAHKPLEREVMEMLKAPWVASQEGRDGFVRQLCQADSRNTDEVEGRYGEVGAKMPVRIIWGAEDKWIPVQTAYKLASALNAKDVVVIDEAGHLLMYDQGERLGVELAWWLRSVL